MTRATGVHLCGDAIRIVSLMRSDSSDHLCGLFEATLPLPFLPATLRDPNLLGQLAKHIRTALATLNVETGCIVPALGKEFYHMQKVPLEVASDEDRREQIYWEASQALISPLDAYSIDYYPSGRSAFWIAIRKEIQDHITSLFDDMEPNLHSPVIAPVALYDACRSAGIWTRERNAAICLDGSRLFFVAGDANTITTAETACMLQDEVETPPEARAISLVKGWIFGDRSREKTGSVFSKIHLCGIPEQIAELSDRLSISASPQLTILDPFAAMDTTGLDTESKHLVARQSVFAVAAGLAFRGLEQENP
jgi:hypothetical protein